MAADMRSDKGGNPRMGKQLLPAELSRFIGREQELRQLLSALRDARLVTITGPGGVGKTRVALELARTLEVRGSVVWVVEMAPLADGQLLVQRVAASLGVRDRPPKSLVDAVRDRLDHGDSILVLDNCEHLAHACAEFVEALLRTCALLRIIATSREALRVAGEHLWPLMPLRLPSRDSVAVSEVGRSEAVRLFVDRATARAPTFRLTRHNATVVGRICRRVDGLPLGIELAAARANVLAPEQIEARLNSSLELLVNARRTAAARQSTLSATFDWSYALLSEQQQRLFERLAVFAGPFDLEAAEAICGTRPVAPAHVLDHLAELVDKSLVVTESDTDSVRYRLLQTVRQYAHARLVDRQELETTQHRQAEWYARLMDMAVRDLRADDPSHRNASQRVRLAQLAREHDNIRATLDWSIQHGETNLCLRLGAGVSRFWLYHGHLSEGIGWLTRILALAGDSYPPHIDGTPYMDCLFSAGLLASQQGDATATRCHFERILQLASVQRAPKARGGAHIQLGYLAFQEGDLAGARAMYEQVIRMLGHAHEWLVANAFGGLTQIALAQGDSTLARRLAEQSLAVYQKLGDERQTAFVWIRLGRIDIDDGRLDAARARLHDGLKLSRELDDPSGMMAGLVGFGFLATAQRHPEQALRLFGAADAHAEKAGISFLRPWVVTTQRAAQAARAMLAEREANKAFLAGRNLTLDQALDEALGAVREPPAFGSGNSSTPTLTRREKEVALLITRGLTNRHIAQRLLISERTVDNHVANILQKLGFSARAQVAAWSIESGIAE
jgi:non-specific serine/threonine protein kinase